MPVSQDLLPVLIRGSRKALFLASRWRLVSYSNGHTVILSSLVVALLLSVQVASKQERTGKNVGERTLNDRGLSRSKSEAICLARMHAYGMGQRCRDSASLNLQSEDPLKKLTAATACRNSSSYDIHLR